MTTITEFSFKQKLLFDFRRMSIVYPAALLIGVAAMAFQSFSGVQLFTFDRQQQYGPLPASQNKNKELPASKPVPSEDLERINLLISQSQQAIDAVSQNLEDSKNQIARLNAENAALTARLQQLEGAQAAIENSPRISDLEAKIAQLSAWQTTVDSVMTLSAGDTTGLRELTIQGRNYGSLSEALHRSLQPRSSILFKDSAKNMMREPSTVMLGATPMFSEKQVTSNSVTSPLPSWTATVGVPYVATLSNVPVNRQF